MGTQETDTSFIEPRHALDLSNEIRRTMLLATQALDGRELSDDELESLCDAILSNKVTPETKTS